MTNKEFAVYKYIISYISTNGYPPSTTEIMKGADISSGREVHRLLTELDEQGHIRIMRGCARAISVPGYAFVKVMDVKKTVGSLLKRTAQEVPKP